MTTAKSEFDHALANRAMGYVDAKGQPVSRAQLDAAMRHPLYDTLLAGIERAWPDAKEKMRLACDIILLAHFTPRADLPITGAAKPVARAKAEGSRAHRDLNAPLILTRLS